MKTCLLFLLVFFVDAHGMADEQVKRKREEQVKRSHDRWLELFGAYLKEATRLSYLVNESYSPNEIAQQTIKFRKAKKAFDCVNKYPEK